MSDKKDSDLVAVMLPREYVEDAARRFQTTGPLPAACKRALRPEPPSEGQWQWLESHFPPHQSAGIVARDIAAFGRYVLEHGWEPDGE